MKKQEAIQRLYNTYSQYGITKELLDRLFEDGISNQHFTLQETYNLLRMSLANEYGEREYFAVAEIASMLNMSEAEIMEEVAKTKAENEAVIQGFKILLSKGTNSL